MSELLANKQIHEDYAFGTGFEQRLIDVYIGMSNQKRPPYLDVIFSEFLQMEALILLDGKLKGSTPPDEWDYMNQQVWENNEMVQIEILQGEYGDRTSDIFMDIFGYLRTHHMTHLIREVNLDLHSKSHLMNNPNVGVW